ncbi:MAG: DUF1003 domain-containing protein [Candidatus Abawacabacteria bacterium]|nr:DUF1003 domain-containing protein [Candidatus Abawacabacteria bacterium]
MSKKKKKKLHNYARVRADLNAVPEVMKQLEDEHVSFGQKLAENLAQFVGSWRFIIFQSSIFCIWIVLNLIGWIQHWDPYPFILLNLFLSFQAAYCGPVIMMAQNRQEAKDRLRSELDFQVNIAAEQEIKKLLSSFDTARLAHMARVDNQLKELLKLLKGRR